MPSAVATIEAVRASVTVTINGTARSANPKPEMVCMAQAKNTIAASTDNSAPVIATGTKRTSLDRPVCAGGTSSRGGGDVSDGCPEVVHERLDAAGVDGVHHAVQRGGGALAVDVPAATPQGGGETEHVERLGIGRSEGQQRRLRQCAQFELGRCLDRLRQLDRRDPSTAGELEVTVVADVLQHGPGRS